MGKGKEQWDSREKKIQVVLKTGKSKNRDGVKQAGGSLGFGRSIPRSNNG